MEHWLEILFGGVGGTILVGLVGWLWSNRQKKKSQLLVASGLEKPGADALTAESTFSEKTQLVSRADSGELTPARIASAIKAASPFARPTIAKNFVGTRIEWDLWLQQILHYGDGNKINLRMSGEKNGAFPQILCDVEVEKFPFLKYVHEGSFIRVKAELNDVSEIQLVLRNVELTLLQAKLAEGS